MGGRSRPRRRSAIRRHLRHAARLASDAGRHADTAGLRPARHRDESRRQAGSSDERGLRQPLADGRRYRYGRCAPDHRHAEQRRSRREEQGARSGVRALLLCWRLVRVLQRRRIRAWRERRVRLGRARLRHPHIRGDRGRAEGGTRDRLAQRRVAGRYRRVARRRASLCRRQPHRSAADRGPGGTQDDRQRRRRAPPLRCRAEPRRLPRLRVQLGRPYCHGRRHEDCQRRQDADRGNTPAP